VVSSATRWRRWTRWTTPSPATTSTGARPHRLIEPPAQLECRSLCSFREINILKEENRAMVRTLPPPSPFGRCALLLTAPLICRKRATSTSSTAGQSTRWPSSRVATSTPGAMVRTASSGTRTTMTRRFPRRQHHSLFRLCAWQASPWVLGSQVSALLEKKVPAGKGSCGCHHLHLDALWPVSYSWLGGVWQVQPLHAHHCVC
jgi:hypothetical protein